MNRHVIMYKLFRCITLIILAFISSCNFDPFGYEETLTEYYEHLTLINCDGANKIDLSEDIIIDSKIFFSEDDQNFFVNYSGMIQSFDLNSKQLNAVFPLGFEEYNISGFEMFNGFEQVLYGDVQGDLFTGTIGTNSFENLTNTIEKRESKPKLSPSGEFFLYIERDFTFTDSVLWSIKYRNFDGSIDDTVVSKFAYITGGYFFVDWIDENTLLYCENGVEITSGLYAVSLDGSNKQLLFNDSYLIFCMNQDRTRAVFESDYEIYLINTCDLSVSHLVSGSKPLISPDGNKNGG